MEETARVHSLKTIQRIAFSVPYGNDGTVTESTSTLRGLCV